MTKMPTKTSGGDAEYARILKLIEKGFYDEAALDLRGVRKQLEWPSQSTRTGGDDWNLLSQLLSFRIAMKRGTPTPQVEWMDEAHCENPFLAGEVCFVKGLHLYHQHQMGAGRSCFERAATYYAESGAVERANLARYNEIIGLTYDQPHSMNLLFSKLRELEAAARLSNQQNIVGLVLRQKSYLYKEAGRLKAALREGVEACALLELYGSISDYQLAALNVVDIHICHGDEVEAETLLEYLIEPFDSRVLFPLSFLRARLKGTAVDPSHRHLSCPHFATRFELYQDSVSIGVSTIESPPSGKAGKSLQWDSLRGELRSMGQVWNFRVGSMEFRLIDCLVSKPHSKQLLCETLWPGHSSLAHLDNRLHRLISRFNKKLGGLISFENGWYRFP